MATTTDTESCQALFCALADFVGSSKINTVLNLKRYPTFWHLTGYTEKNAKGYKKTLKEVYAIEKKNNKETLPFKDWVEEITSPKLLELINKQRHYKLRISEDDWKKNNKYLDDAMKFTIVNASGLPKMKEVLDDELGWYVSSVKIAEKLLSALKRIDPQYDIKGAGCQMVYHRGDEEIMGVIAELFKKANDTAKSQKTKSPGFYSPTVFGDINKWSPADMYFATAAAKRELDGMLVTYKTANLRWEVLNNMISEQIDKGQLLPLSLKKVKDDVHLQKFNWDKRVKQKLVESVKYNAVKDWNPMPPKDTLYKTSPTFKWIIKNGKGPVYPLKKTDKITKETISYREIKLNFTVEEKVVGLNEWKMKPATLQFRHTPASKGGASGTIKTVLGYEGLNAISAGQVASVDILLKLIALGDEVFAKELKVVYDNGMKAFEKDAKPYLEAYGTRLYEGHKDENWNLYLAENKLDEWGGFGGYLVGNTTISKDKLRGRFKTIFNEDMGAISGVTLMNPLRDKLEEYFSTTGKAAEKKKSDVIMEIFRYASSRTDHSAKFVIAK
jgi:hypothetical protein